jgi:hypothetical protein
MAGKINKAREPRRDREDRAMLKHMGDPSHINGEEAKLLARVMPESHGKVVTRGLLADAGRRGDDRVTLLTPEEAALLKARGGAGTRNPKSGLLEFYGDSPGTSGGGGGEGGDNGVGGPGNGSAGTGPGQGPGPGDAGYGGDYGGYSGVGYGFSNYSAPEDRSLGYSDISNFGGIGQPGAGSIGPNGEMDNFASYAGALTDAAEEAGYAPLDTVKRLVQNIVFGPPRNIARQVPGRYSAPNKHGTGVVGTALGMMVGGPMSLGMRAGMNMAQSMSPEAQERSMAENQAIGSQNSTGQDRDSSTGLSFAELSARNIPGAASGSQTAGLLAEQVGLGGGTSTTAPGSMPTVTPGGVTTTGDYGRSSSTLTGLPLPVQNLLADYIWRGRQGSGFNW